MNTFLKISFRHLWHSRLYTGINIVGLATGLTCMLLAVLYWKDEHGYDSFHENHSQLYRITTTMVRGKGEKEQTTGGSGQVQGPAFKASIPEVKNYVRILGGDIYSDVMSNNKLFHLQTFFVDESFFDVFSFNLLRGNPATVLSGINSVVITESTARKFFNTIDVVGKFLTVDADPSFKRYGRPLLVSGVVEDPPKNSSLQFDALFTFKFLHLSFDDTNWLNAYLGTFVVLHPNADINAVTHKFKKVYTFHAKEHLAENFKNYGYDPNISYGLQPMEDIHLNPLMRANGNAEAGIINGSSPVYSQVFLGVSLLILFMASINFINISIANSLKRAKEVGIKKIAGGSRRQIIIQFLNETVLMCLIAFLISLILLHGSLPVFNSLTGKQMSLSDAIDVKLLLYFLSLLICIIVLTGLYPAFILSNFKASEVLYNKQKLSSRNLFGRSLVVVQFSLALLLLIAAIVYYAQMDYVRTKDLGYNSNHVIRTNIFGSRDYRSVITYLKNELAKEPAIKTVSFGTDGYPEDIAVNGRIIKAQYKKIDENFLTALEIPFKTGLNFSGPFSASGSNSVIVNESFIKASGIKDLAGTGATLKITDDSNLKTIQAVVKDFNFGSLHEPVKPMVMYRNEWSDGGMWIKFEKSKQKEALAAIERIYKKAMPDAFYQYAFLDELNARQYLQEQRWKQVITIATAVSFVICCLGLFGLAHLSTHQRIKEIGIRKVLGASVGQIVAMLSGDFIKLVIFSFVIAAPISWMVMNSWLQNFAYRISIGPGIFIMAIVMAMVMALAAVSMQSIKSALSNPVKSLKTQ